MTPVSQELWSSENPVRFNTFGAIYARQGTDAALVLPWCTEGMALHLAAVLEQVGRGQSYA